MMDQQKTYVCLGTCQAVITEEQYKNGLTSCGGEGCSLHGHTFTEGNTCATCGKNYQEGAEHTHN